MSAPRTVSRIPWKPPLGYALDGACHDPAADPLPVTIVVFKRTCGRCGRVDQDLRLEESS